MGEGDKKLTGFGTLLKQRRISVQDKIMNTAARNRGTLARFRMSHCSKQSSERDAYIS